MKAKEIVNLSDEELLKKLQELKDIARVNTVIRARQLKA